MNKLERYVYDRVQFYPRLKRLIVDIYQRIFSIIPINAIESEYPVVVREKYFYGFHDKCPWSSDNRMLLAHRFNNPLKKPGPEDEVEVGFFSGEDYVNFKPVGKTKTWNWQQGSMLQWVGDSKSIAYNDFDGRKHVTKILDLKDNLIRVLPRPTAIMSTDGKYVLSYSFIRLFKYAKAYGYANGSEPEENVPVPTEDGLYIIEVDSAKVHKLFSIAEIAEFQQEPSMKNAHHYFTHGLFSLSGRRFVFFHRWLTARGRTWTRMFSCDLTGKNLYVFPTNGTVTHITWRDENTILAYASTNEFGSHYYIFEDKTGKFSILGRERFTSDGHPQFSPDKSKIITDTYPNRMRIQNLILYEIESDRRIDLAKIRSPFKYRYDLRCDLHPRWNRDGTMVCFDSAHTGIRSLCTLRL